MKRLLILAGLLSVVFLAAFSIPPAEATMCTTTCSDANLSCTPMSSCTSVPGTSITCDGVTTTCTTANAYCTCTNNCTNNYIACLQSCPGCQLCDTSYNHCSHGCGTAPPNTGC